MKTYAGSCHCGDVTFEVDGDFTEGTVCNCSMCSRAGWKLCFVGEDAMRISHEAEAVTDYQFGAKHIHHLFCSRCGVRSYGYGHDGDGQKMYAINLRCLAGFNAEAAGTVHYDGAAL